MERLARIAFAAGAVAVAAAVALGAFESSVEVRLEQARRLAYDRKPKEAAAEYRALLGSLEAKEDVGAVRLEALARLGDLLFLELGDHRGAAEIYRELIASYPHSEEHWAARERLAELSRLHLRDPHEAIAQWKALAAANRPGADRFAFEAARQYFKLSEWEQCRKETEELVERWPESDWVDDALFLLATTYQFEGRHAEAVAAFEEVERRFEGRGIASRARYQVGQLLAADRDWEGALISFVEALKGHPDPWRVQADIARARKHLAELRQLKPGDVTAALGR